MVGVAEEERAKAELRPIQGGKGSLWEGGIRVPLSRSHRRPAHGPPTHITIQIENRQPNLVEKVARRERNAGVVFGKAPE